MLSQDKATGPESGVEDKGKEVRGGKVGRMMGCGSQTRALLSTLGGLKLWDRETLCDGSSEVREPPREIKLREEGRKVCAISTRFSAWRSWSPG